MSHEFVFEAELLPYFPDLVLEEQTQRLDEREAHPLGQAADVVMALDDVRWANH